MKVSVIVVIVIIVVIVVVVIIIVVVVTVVVIVVIWESRIMETILRYKFYQELLVSFQP